jgi:hypothetical protein
MSKDKKIEQQRLALEVEKLAKEKEDVGRTIMFINPRMLDDKAREYWELSRAKILARDNGGGGGDGGRDGV